jgi:hypothetical protein
MALKDPVAVYDAATNLEAHFVSNLLNEAGVEAYATEDIAGSDVAASVFGGLPGIHKPQVWVDRADVEHAQPVLLDYEVRLAERREAEAATALPIQIRCEDCGQKSVFDYALRGTVQTCPHCGAYLDVELTDELPEGFTSEDIQEGDAED